MFCTECGTPGEGKFCGQCGHPLNASSAPKGPPRLPPVDWTWSLDYLVVSSAPQVRAELEMAEARAGQKVGGDKLIDAVDQVMQPFTGGVSTRLAAKLSKPLTSALGFKTGKSHREVFALPPGKVLARVLIALAEHGHKLTGVEQRPDQCTLTAAIPADLCSIDGALRVTVARAAGGTELQAEALIEGQWYDWGKCRRRLDELFENVRGAAA